MAAPPRPAAANTPVAATATMAAPVAAARAPEVFEIEAEAVALWTGLVVIG